MTAAPKKADISKTIEKQQLCQQKQQLRQQQNNNQQAANSKQQTANSKQQAAIDNHQGMFLVWYVVPVQVARMTCKCCERHNVDDCVRALEAIIPG